MNGKYTTINASGVLVEEQAINATTGAPDAAKIIRTDGDGKLSASFFPATYIQELKVLPASEDLAAGDLVNVWNDSGTAKVRKANASAANAEKEAHGFVLAGVTAPASATVMFEGINDQLTGRTKGAIQFLSDTTPGAVTETPVTTSGYLLQRVGVAVSATEMTFERAEGIIRA